MRPANFSNWSTKSNQNYQTWTSDILAHRVLKCLPMSYFIVFKQIIIQPIQGLPDKSLTAQNQTAINLHSQIVPGQSQDIL
jgi:hypothetical protein